MAYPYESIYFLHILSGIRMTIIQENGKWRKKVETTLTPLVPILF